MNQIGHDAPNLIRVDTPGQQVDLMMLAREAVDRLQDAGALQVIANVVADAAEATPASGQISIASSSALQLLGSRVEVAAS